MKYKYPTIEKLENKLGKYFTMKDISDTFKIPIFSAYYHFVWQYFPTIKKTNRKKGRSRLYNANIGNKQRWELLQ